MSEWKEVYLGNVCDLIAGFAFKSGDFGEHQDKALKIGDIKPPYVDYSSMSGIDLSKYSNKNLDKYKVEYDDFVLAMTGATIGKIGRYVEHTPCYINQRVLMFKPHNKVERKFIYHVLCSNLFQKYIVNHIDSESAQPNISANTLSKYSFNLPDLPTQRRIAAILSSLDAKIENNNKVNAKLEEIAQNLFKEWFVDFGPFKDGKFVDSELGPIPEGWRVESLGNICDSISETKKFDKESIVFLNTGDIENGLFLHKNYSKVDGLPGQAKKSIRKDDILYSEIRPINRHYAYVQFDADDYVVSTKLMVIRCRNVVGSRRLYQYLTSDDVVNELQVEAESRSGTFPQIRFEIIQRRKMVVATTEEENKFSQIIGSIYEKIDSINEENQRLATLRDTLLPKLMSGEIEV